MKSRITFLLGIAGAGLFVAAAVIGGLLIDGYDPVSQYISESFALDTTYGTWLRVLGYIPSGVLLALFCYRAVSFFPQSPKIRIGFYGIAIFYGLATVLVGLFPCDSGCNREWIDPSISQWIHNLVAFVTYLVVPAMLILIGWELRQSLVYKMYALRSMILGGTAALFVLRILTDPNADHIGLYQRLVELSFVSWIVFTAFKIKTTSTS